MVSIINNSSVYGAQPRSLNINWMKFDVLDLAHENVDPNTTQWSRAKHSPLREKLQIRADQVMQKRQLLTNSDIEKRISEARIRRDHSSNEALGRKISPKMARAGTQQVRQTYLSEMARKRHSHEESRYNEYQ